MGTKIEPKVTYVTHIMTCAKKKNLTQVKEGGGKTSIFLFFPFSQCVPIMFSMSSQILEGFPSFPKCFQMHSFPQDIPNSTWVLSHMVCPNLNSPVYKLKT
jgi:hypothetical protein